MQTRTSPSCQALHRLAKQASIPNYSTLSKGDLYDKLKESYDIDRLARAESRGSKTKGNKRDLKYEDLPESEEGPSISRKKARVKSKSANTFDPIMREPLGKHVYTFVRPNGSCARFNVESLIDYLLASGDFSDPESRLPFSDEDLKMIDHMAQKSGLKKKSVLSARRDHTKDYADQHFVRDALMGLERCAGEVVTEMLSIIEECDYEEAEMRLVLREIPSFADLYRQIREADPEFAKQCMLSWRIFLAGPPNRPTEDEVGLLQIVLHFMRNLESGTASIPATSTSSYSQDDDDGM